MKKMLQKNEKRLKHITERIMQATVKKEKFPRDVVGDRVRFEVGASCEDFIILLLGIGIIIISIAFNT